jgi:hypothetical protein
MEKFQAVSVDRGEYQGFWSLFLSKFGMGDEENDVIPGFCTHISKIEIVSGRSLYKLINVVAIFNNFYAVYTD